MLRMGMVILWLASVQCSSRPMLTKDQTPEPISETPYESTTESAPLVIEETWGIKIVGIRLTAADHMIDFRYHVLDSEKASILLSRQVQPYLIDQSTGTKLFVPRIKIGPMRQTAVKPPAGRNYVILFGNTNGSVKSGSKVTVVIGDLKIEDLVVE